MRRLQQSFVTLPLLGALLSVAAVGCSHSGDSSASNALGQDSSLARDLQMVNADTSAQPQLRDVPAPPDKPQVAEQSTSSKSRITPPQHRRTEPPVTPPKQEEPQQQQVVRTPPPPHPVAVQPMPPLVNTAKESGAVTDAHGAGAGVGVIGAGALLSLTSGQRICTNTHSVGDRFTATVAEPVEGTNGVVIPSGATAVLELTTLKKAEGPRDSAIVRFTLRAIAIDGKSYTASGDLIQEQVDRVASANNNDGKKVAAGAAIGAIAGQIFGHKTKSTIIGAAAGAAAGAGVAIATAKYDGCVPNGGRIVMKINQPITVAKL